MSGSRHKHLAPNLAAKVDYLADPHHHAGHPRSVTCIETHFAWVFLVGTLALKLKKPLRQASMNYETLADRERACRRELLLNRRLAPEVYLRVHPLLQTRTGRLSLRAGVRVVDWLVEMRRLPTVRCLEHALLKGTVAACEWERLAAELAAFFTHAQPRPMSDRAYLARLRREVTQTGRELSARDLGLPVRQVAALTKIQLQVLEKNAGLFKGRGRRVRDGHGDLRPEHVFLGSRTSRPCVIDCLEFDPDLRRLDPAEETAFLALECERLAGEPAAVTLLACYRRHSGDPVPDALIDFYMSRRAAVRAQISAWHLRDPAFARERQAWRARTDAYLHDALRLGRRCATLIARQSPAIAPTETRWARRRPSDPLPRRATPQPKV